MSSPTVMIATSIFVIATITILLLLGFIMIILFLYRKRQQKFAIQLENIKTNAEKEVLKTQLEIQEQTFLYISQEIHDNIGQFLSLAKLQLNTLDFSQMNAAEKVKIAHSADLLTKALDDLRDLSRSLSSDLIRSNGLAVAIETQITQLNKLGLVDVRYEASGEYPILDERKEIFIVRIIQEAISNIIRHSDARTVNINLNYAQGQLSLLIRDDGRGFDKTIVRGPKLSGVSNMAKRAELIGARFNIESKVGEGTTIELFLPV